MPARVKIVHFADLHLDSGFAWAGAGGAAARRRRQSLRDALESIATLARDVDVGALFCGGDLYEHERVTPDTGRFLQETFAKLAPRPVYLAPGNHDWYGPRSLYRETRGHDRLRPAESARLGAGPPPRCAPVSCCGVRQGRVGN